MIGSDIGYLLTVKNGGPSAATNVVQSTGVPANTTYQSMQVPAGWSCTAPGAGAGAITCTAANLNAGYSGALLLSVRVRCSLEDGATVNHPASAVAEEEDLNPGDNSCASAITVSNPTGIFPTGAPFDSRGGSGTVNITIPHGCSWLAVRASEFVTITSAAGMGSDTLQFTVAANATPVPQAGTLVIARQTLTVWQGSTCTDGSASLPAGSVSWRPMDRGSALRTGSAQVIPDAGSFAPSGLRWFRYAPRGILITETASAATSAATRTRIYIDHAENHWVDLAIAGTEGTPLSVTLQAYETGGATPAGSSSLQLPGGGQVCTRADHRAFSGGLPAYWTFRLLRRLRL